MSKLIKKLLSRCNSVIFKYAVKSGLILCVADSEEFEEEEEQETEEENKEPEKEQEESEEVEQEEIDEVSVSIEGEEPEEQEEQTAAPAWVKDLRKSHRESQKRIKELEAQLTQVAPAEKQEALGQKPTLELCEYDAEKFESELEAWHERKRKAEELQRKQQAEQEAVNKQWQAKLDGYQKAKKELKVKDFEDAEDFVKDNFSVTQQGIIVKGCKDPALVIYALGKNPKKAKELAAISDPIEYAFAIAELQNKMKVINRKPATQPEKTVRSGNAGLSGTVDNQLDRLRNEAEKTGDYSKVLAYKQQQRNKK